MKRIILALAAVSFMSPAFAADNEDKNEVTIDKSKNPITGTKTVTKTTKIKQKGDSSKAEAEIVEKAKIKKDGTVTESKEVEASSDAKHKHP